MSKFEGRFVWYELITSDPQAAKAFYSEVVGWTTQDMPMEGFTYTVARAGEAPVAGMMAIPAEAKAMGVPPNWTGYVAVSDVDAELEQAKSLGGRVLREAEDAPGIGRFAIIADPHGAVVALFKGDGEGPMDPGQDVPGHVGWHELYAGELESAFSFYSALFGWKKQAPFDMGAMGIYQIFGVEEPAIGGMLTKPAQMPVPAWIYYFNVGDIDAAAGRVTGRGGKILMGPMEVPGGGWVLQATDPQGAVFALLGMRKT